ncbi:MAG: hypothetical protein NW226_13600 [Microscillaceae bacterium]|nr:hypothetical protein [Microscillaceae bacterium]
MERYKLRMNEQQFREKISQMWSQVRFQSQEKPQLFFEEQSFVVKPVEEEPRYFFKGEYQNGEGYLDLRLSFPESPQRNDFFSGIIWKILMLSSLLAVAFYLLFFSIVAYLSVGIPVFSFLSVFVILNFAANIWANLYAYPDTLFFEERFLDLFDRHEIVKLD